MEETARRLADAVSHLGGRAFRREVPVDVLPREEVRARVAAAALRDYPPEAAAPIVRAGAALGFWPEGFDLAGTLADLRGSDVAARYDPDLRRVLVAAPPGTGLDGAAECALAHELAHALRDEASPIPAFLDAAGPSDDARLARLSVVEGEATLLGYAALLWLRYGADDLAAMPDLAPRLAGDPAPDPSFPLLLRRTLLAPYADGVALVQAALRRGGPDALDGLYRDPPASTEQVLHPERFLDRRDDPVPLALGAPAAGFVRVLDNTLGELGCASLLETLGVPADRAREAARGWDGDRYLVAADATGRDGVVLASAWDDADEAEEFRRAWWEARTGAPPPEGGAAPAEASPLEAPRGGRFESVERRGARVVAVGGARAEDLAPLREFAWGAWGE